MHVPGGIPLDELDGDERDQHDKDLEPDVKTTFAHFGLACYQASVLEHEIVNVLALNRLVTARRNAEQLISDPWDDKFKRTMGVLVEQLGAYAQCDPELAADLVQAVQLRNDLAHRFWRERAEDFCSEAGRARMIAYLIAARKQFEDVDERLTASMGAAALKQGNVTPQTMDPSYHDMLGRVKRGELNVPLSTVRSVRRVSIKLRSKHPLYRILRSTPGDTSPRDLSRKQREVPRSQPQVSVGVADISRGREGHCARPGLQADSPTNRARPRGKASTAE